ncbi:MAG TPA: DUF222 domain-containing protein [Candidatus Acidoferrum sp.]|nr:DUF222 domain-containing protein [Candidatus Acidoferrum sp.]
MGEGGPSPKERERVKPLVDEFMAELLGPVDPDDIESRLKLQRWAIDQIELQFSRDSAILTGRAEFQDGTEWPTHWLRHRCHMKYGAAQDRLNVGEQLHRLPRTADAVSNGDIGYAHLSVVAGMLSSLGESVEGVAFDETEVLEQAKTVTPGRLARFCDRLKHALKPELVATEQRIAAEERWLKFTPQESGSVFLTGQLDQVGAAAVRTAIEPLARRTGEADDRCLQRRQGDALVELAMLSLDSGRLPHVASQRPHLQVTTSLETLRGLAGAPAADLEFSAPIATATVQRLACDSSISRVVFGPDSVVVDVGRARRVVSPATRRAPNARDQVCQWPGCERTASQSAAHHLVHWVEGGATDLKNMILLCHRHHWMVHEGGWQLVRAKDERLCTIPPAWDYFYRTRAPDENAA